MRKKLPIMCIILITIIFLAGCEVKNNISKDSSRNSTASSMKTEELKKVGDPKTMDDNQFIEAPIKGEDKLKLDNIDSGIEDIDNLDTNISTNDPIADIPNK